MTFSRIRLELGRTDEYPDGNQNHGYEFVAPLTPEGHIDPQAWKENKAKCIVRHFEGMDIKGAGLLSRAGRGWRFEYGPEGRAGDEPFYRLDQHIMRPGLYVSLREHDGVQRPFKVVSVTPLPRAPSDRRT